MARRGPEEEQGHLHGGRNHRKKRAAVCTGDVQTSAADVQTSASMLLTADNSAAARGTTGLGIPTRPRVAQWRSNWEARIPTEAP